MGDKWKMVNGFLGDKSPWNQDFKEVARLAKQQKEFDSLKDGAAPETGMTSKEKSDAWIGARVLLFAAVGIWALYKTYMAYKVHGFGSEKFFEWCLICVAITSFDLIVSAALKSSAGKKKKGG